MVESDCGLLLSCEHGGNLVPEPWQPLFAGQEKLLESHRGYDLGVAAFARWLADQLRVPLHLSQVTRLLVELNRSIGHPNLYSEFSKALRRHERNRLLDLYYHPYREAVIREIEQLLTKHERVFHVSLHTFTPELHGEVRTTDIGLLYHPQRAGEKAFCRKWRENIHLRGEGWTVRRNAPYRGTMDGFVSLLRRQFPEDRYLGFELELNQRWPLLGGDRWQCLQSVVRDTLRQTLHQQGRKRLDWNDRQVASE